ncbi:MAG TPA: NUDIX hydrolase [Vitreimonas sp.]|uniref:NUDIX hydrolase n=1 Tax=Vitreimonas sp. TaxID=3069702 RepID=UPI002D46F216|nr:NUDIX hydrolase [Vitreimonas sp.]HYD87686.1 NUDIX hydrolase [Vitreimonas sp.]
MEDAWLSKAKRLQAIASTGLHFTKDAYDRERFLEVGAIANAMLAELGNVPLARIEGLVSDFAQGYATPKVDVRGAVIRGDRVLLVQERSDARWTLPGGFADIGLSAGRNVEKEIDEEAGLRVKAERLYAVRHKAKQPYEPDARDFYKLFFLCEALNESEPAPGAETLAAAFFPLPALPDLSVGRTVRSDIEAAFAARANAALPVLFD